MEIWFEKEGLGVGGDVVDGDDNGNDHNNNKLARDCLWAFGN